MSHLRLPFAFLPSTVLMADSDSDEQCLHIAMPWRGVIVVTAVAVMTVVMAVSECWGGDGYISDRPVLRSSSFVRRFLSYLGLASSVA